MYTFTDCLKYFFHQLFSDVISRHGLCCCLRLAPFLNLVIETVRDVVCSERLKWLHIKLIF